MGFKQPRELGLHMVLLYSCKQFLMTPVEVGEIELTVCL